MTQPWVPAIWKMVLSFSGKITALCKNNSMHNWLIMTWKKKNSSIKYCLHLMIQQYKLGVRLWISWDNLCPSTKSLSWWRSCFTRDDLFSVKKCFFAITAIALKLFYTQNLVIFTNMTDNLTDLLLFYLFGDLFFYKTLCTIAGEWKTQQACVPATWPVSA